MLLASPCLSRLLLLCLHTEGCASSWIPSSPPNSRLTVQSEWPSCQGRCMDGHKTSSPSLTLRPPISFSVFLCEGGEGRTELLSFCQTFGAGRASIELGSPSSGTGRRATGRQGKRGRARDRMGSPDCVRISPIRFSEFAHSTQALALHPDLRTSIWQHTFNLLHGSAPPSTP